MTIRNPNIGRACRWPTPYERAPAPAPSEGGPDGSGRRLESTTLISRNLSRRLERLEDSLLPVLEEPLVIHIICVDGDGRREDSGIEFKVQAVPKPFNKRRW
jgi:hypothetical protein